MKKQAFNPYLPSWEYVPDGEPYVFDGRVYVYGSHDRFAGYGYCLNDYVCWSAPADELGDWRYEGVIYTRTDDPANAGGDMVLFAPDVTRGPDGRYYLYYVLDKRGFVSVAVCDSPAGRYQFYGYVHYPDGTRLGDAPGDEPNFDPGVLTEGDTTYLYTGFCMPQNRERHGAMVTVLGADMLSVTRAPAFVAPGKPYAAGTGYEGHEFFEASSIRKRSDTYYFIYSSVNGHELCYGRASTPLGPFAYGGVIVSNCDKHIDSYKPAEQPMFYGANNHGSIVEIAGVWYIFYHRHTNGTNYSRQGCIEKIAFAPDGGIPQAEMTSCGANGGPLAGEGTYPAHIACNLYCRTPCDTTGGPGDWMDDRFPKITQEGRDGDHCPGYIANMRDGATAGFKYFDCRGVRQISVTTRGGGGAVEVRIQWDGELLGHIPVEATNEWHRNTAPLALPDGVQALYFTFRGHGAIGLLEFTLTTGAPMAEKPAVQQKAAVCNDLETSMLLFDPQNREARAEGHVPMELAYQTIHYVEAEPAIALLPDGKVRFMIDEPDAKSVEVTGLGSDFTGKQGRHPLCKEADGLWRATVGGVLPGFHYMEWVVDGRPRINPRAPVGYGASRAINYFEQPGPDTDFYRMHQVPHGTVRMEYYHSKTTGRQRDCLIYTPPGYETSNKRYPVLYLQHGGGESETGWVWQGKINQILDNLIAAGECKEMLVVMNNGYSFLPQGGENASLGAIDKVIVRDCIPFVDAKYRTLPVRTARAMAGLSMGGFQTQRTVLRNLDTFGAMGMFSAVFITDDGATDFTDVLQDAPRLNRALHPLFVSSGESEPMCAQNRATLQALSAQGLNSMFFSTPGGHEWQVWRYSARAFLRLVFQ